MLYTVSAEDYSVWQYHKVLSVTGNTTAIPAGYQINFTLYKGAGTDAANIFYLNNRAENDLADLRFVDGEGTLLDMWNETTIAANHVHVWIELAGSLTVIMYYGNEYADSEFDVAAAVFESVISSGVVLSMPLNEGVGVSCNDYSGNANTGAITDAEWVTTGRFNNGLSFNSDTDVIAIADSASLQLGSTGTVAVYFKSAGTQSGVAGFVAKQEGGSTAVVSYCLYHPDSGADNNEITLYISDSATQNFGSYIWDYADSTEHFITGQWNTSNLWVSFDTTKGSLGTQTINPQADFAIEAGNWLAYINGTISGIYLFNISLSDAQVSSMNSYYPQCSASNLGSLFLREWLDTAPTLSATAEVNADDSPDYTAIYTFGLFAVLAVVLLLFKFGFPLLNMVFGIIALSVVAVTLGSEYVIFAPYLQLGVALTTIILMIASVQKGVKH